ncbi:nucleotidyltransferase domain-containing protein [Candidatus Woesearchaeota archaeon]|nr:nucleotidyltransferase domain-containing protein [Candidatus Woesearchaeota archaeon]
MSHKKLRELLSSVVEKNTPETDDSRLKMVNDFLKRASAEAKHLKIKALPVLGGSFAKGVWLKGDYDVDVFLAFDLKYKNSDLSALSEKILAPFKPVRIHGSRDYFQVRNSICFEIIPVLNIKKASDARNVTDFSLWHVAWVNKKSKKLKNDIRVAKKFCKAQRVYGAESFIRGFSGHVLDILVIHYNGFLPLLKAAVKWNPKVVVDTENHYKGRALQFINKSKTESPLVIVDPVQPGRNASAALSDEKFFDFINAAKLFLKHPSMNFFVETPVDESALRKKGILIKVKMLPIKGIENVVGVKLLKAGEFIKKSLDEFGIIDSLWEWDKKNYAVWWFVVRKKELPSEMLVEGPPLKLKEHVKKFRQVHKKTIVKKNKIYAFVKRPFTIPEETVAAAVKDAYFKEKVKSVFIE